MILANIVLDAGLISFFKSHKKNIKSKIPNTISFNGKGVHLFEIIDLRQ
jgi:hypothetical protein|tara:strand:- start:772 stop:918 length:147 start_codon:yes stop_codon:yes gene_type:complete